ncbi:MAG: hypothetical protein ACT6Q3_14535 [Sphingopyxis sp.]
MDFDLIEDVLSAATLDAERLLGIDLEDAIGLYVFSIRTSGGGHYPYYVGQTCNQSLPQRSIRNKDKKGFYDTILQKCGFVRGTPCITFLPLLTPSGRTAGIGTNDGIISDAEVMLIGACKSANNDLWNLQHNSEPKFEVHGFTKIDRRIPTEKAFAELLHASPANA